MRFSSRQIKGQGRGHEVGYPTINLVVPDYITLDQGVYASTVIIDNIKYKGALHYGVIPTFGLKDKTMEVHLLDINDETVPATMGKEIKIEIVKFIRGVKKFANKEELAEAIKGDVEEIRKILA